MKKICFIISATALLLLLTACSKDDSEQVANGRHIVFECKGQWSQQQTRSIGSNDFCQDVCVSAAYFTGSWSDACTPNFMHKEKLVLNNNQNGYNFDGGAYWYWPNSGKLRFFAYGPYDAVRTSLSDAGTAGAPILSYTCPQPTAGQYDVQYTQSVDYECATGSTVSLPFNHILSALAVTMDPAVGSVESVTLRNIASTGTYTPGSGWSNQGGTTDFSWNNPTDGSGLFVALIPQNLAGTSAKLITTITLKSDNTQHVITYDLADKNIQWNTSTIYHYEIKVEGGTFIPTGPEPTTQLIIGIAEWEAGGAAIIAPSAVYDNNGNLTDDVHNFIFTLPADYTSEGDPTQSSMNFVYLEDSHITGYPTTADNETSGNAVNGDEDTGINSFDNSGEGHDGNANNNNNTEGSDSNGINTSNDDYSPGQNGNNDGTNSENNADQSDHSGYDNTSITNYPDNPDQETNGNATNGDESTGINGFDNSGEGHDGNANNSDDREGDNNNGINNDDSNHVSDDYSPGENGNSDGTNSEDNADQSDMTTVGDDSGDNSGDNSIDIFTDGDQSTDGNAVNGDEGTDINGFDTVDPDINGYAHSEGNSGEGGDSGGNSSEPPSNPSNSPSRSETHNGDDNNEDNDK